MHTHRQVQSEICTHIITQANTQRHTHTHTQTHGATLYLYAAGEALGHMVSLSQESAHEQSLHLQPWQLVTDLHRPLRHTHTHTHRHTHTHTDTHELSHYI